MLFRSPRLVVQARLAGETTYVKPLRYAIFTTTVSTLVALAFAYFIIPDEPAREWLLPARLAELNERYNNFYNNFFPFIILLTIVPLSIVLMKLLFFRKSWREISIIMLYAFGQFWILMLLTIWVMSETLEIILQLSLFILVFIFFRKLFSGNFWLSLLKWIGMTCLMLFWFHQICINLVVYTYVQLGNKPNILGIVKPDASHPASENRTIPELDWYDYSRNDPEHTLLSIADRDTSRYVACVTLQQDTLWSRTFASINRPRYFRVKLPSGKLGWVITLENVIAGGPALQLLTETGELLFTRTYAQGIILNCGTIRANTLIVGGGKKSGDVIVPFIEAINFILTDGKFSFHSERSYSLANPRQRFLELFPVETGPGDEIELIASKYEISVAGIVQMNAAEISNLSIMRMRLDTALHTQWETVIFQKITHYSPTINEFRTKLDTLTQRITTTYPLPTDSLVVSKLSQLDLHGTVLWQEDIIESDYTRIFDFATDSSGVYYCGTAVQGFPRHPLVRFYGLAILGHISADGKTERHLRYGKFSHGERYSFTQVIPGDSTLTVFDFHETQNMLGLDRTRAKLTFSKRELIKK
jgi:hypothetical protein